MIHSRLNILNCKRFSHEQWDFMRILEMESHQNPNLNKYLFKKLKSKLLLLFFFLRIAMNFFLIVNIFAHFNFDFINLFIHCIKCE